MNVFFIASGIEKNSARFARNPIFAIGRSLFPLALNRILFATLFFAVMFLGILSASDALAQSASVQFTRNYGTAANNARANAITSDSSGNIYLTGTFNGATLVFGGTTLTKIGSQDGFVVKINSAGTVLWAQNFGGSAAVVTLQGIAVDNAATPNVYVTGYFSGADLTTPGLTKIGTSDGLLIKMSGTAGSTTWSQNFGGAGATVQLTSVVADRVATPNVYVAGYLSGANLSTPSLTKIGTQDALVIKMPGTGGATPTWSQNFGGAGSTAQFNGVAVDTASPANVYLGGYFSGANLSTPSLTLGGTQDALVMKMPGIGGAIPTWTQNFSGAGATAQFNGITVDTAGTPNIYLGGHFNGANLTTPSLSRFGTQDALVMKMPGTGGATPTWTQNFGGAGASAQVNGIAIDTAATPNIFIDGWFATANLTTPALTNVGNQDGLVIKMPGTGGATPTYAQAFNGAGAQGVLLGIAIDGASLPNAYVTGYLTGANLTTPSITRIGSTDAFLIKYGVTPGAPGAPTSPSATAGNGQATVTFTAPAFDGNSTITGYTATASPGGATGTCSGASACAITVTGLTKGTSYTFTVTATNAIGTGSASVASNAVTSGNGSNSTTTDTTPPPPFLGKTSDVTPINFTVTPVSGPGSVGTAVSQLPSTVFTNTSGPLTFTLSALGLTNAATGSSGLLNIQVPVSNAIAGNQTVNVTFDTAARKFNITAPVTIRPGARTTTAKASAQAASVLNPFLVTGPRSLVVATSIFLTGNDANGNAGTLKIPMTLYAPGETTDLTAVSIDQSNNFGLTASTTPAISRDGQVISFQSTASNLGILYPTAFRQIVRYAVPLGKVDYISQSSFMGDLGGTIPTGGESFSSALSADGSTLSFASDGRNIYPLYPDPGVRQVFVTSANSPVDGLSPRSPRPLLLNGLTVTGSSDAPAMSADGSLIAFTSSSALVSGVAAGISQIYVKNTSTGVISLCSSDTSGSAGNAPSTNPAISDDGRYLLFASQATNFGSQSSQQQLYLKDRITGALNLISAGPSGISGNGTSANGHLSADGAYAVFESNATNLVAGADQGSGSGQIYVRVLSTGSNLLVSQSTTGSSEGGTGPAISGDGRFVVFKSSGANIVKGIASTSPQIYVRDIFRGISALVTTDVNGRPANDGSDAPNISADGRTIAFASIATNLDGTGTNGVSQIYIAANPIPAPVANGIWINPNIAGQYFLVEQSGNKLFFGNLGFGSDLTPAWSIALESALGNSGYAGPLIQFANGQSLADAYQPARAGIALGVAGFLNPAATSATLSLPAGSQSVQRWDFGTGGAAAGQVTGYPETGWWWNAAEPGRALFLEIQGNSLFASILGYSATGSVIWYQSQGTMSSSSTYTGTLNICSGANTSICIASAGNIAFNFTSTLAGTFTLPNGRTIPIQRYRF